MRPDDLFIEAARELQPGTYGIADSGERQRLDELATAVRNRAADLLDTAFRKYGTVEDENNNEDFVVKLEEVEDASNDTVWSGEVKVMTLPDGSEEDGRYKQVTRRWVCVDVIAEEEFDIFAPEGFYVKKRILIGTHDLRFSSDSKKTWGPISRGVSLETATTLFVVPNASRGMDGPSLNDVVADDPFGEGPVILERMNQGYPVFSEDEDFWDNGFARRPLPYKYPNRQGLIEGIHASLDTIEEALR